MNKSRVLFLLASGLVVLPLASGLMNRAWAQKDDGQDSLYKYLSVFTDVLRLVRGAYVEEEDLQVLMSGALDGVADALDPFSVFVPAAEVRGYLEVENRWRQQSGFVPLRERGVAWVASIDEGGPAQSAGLRRGDVLSKIDGISTRDMPRWRLLRYLGKKEAGSLHLEVVRQGDRLEFELVLATFEVPAPRVEEHDAVTVVRFFGLDNAAVERAAELLAQVKPSSSLAIDIRGVASGEAAAGYRLAALFAQGELGLLKGRDGELATFNNDQPVRWAGPVGLIVDRGTQGAAEVFASVVAQKGSGILVGDQTFGYAGRLAQTRLSNGSLLQLTDGFYTGPDGEPIDEGLQPELEVSLRRFGPNQADLDREFLDKSLELLRERLAKRAAA